MDPLHLKTQEDMHYYSSLSWDSGGRMKFLWLSEQLASYFSIIHCLTMSCYVFHISVSSAAYLEKYKKGILRKITKTGWKKTQIIMHNMACCQQFIKPSGRLKRKQTKNITTKEIKLCIFVEIK